MTPWCLQSAQLLALSRLPSQWWCLSDLCDYLVMSEAILRRDLYRFALLGVSISIKEQRVCFHQPAHGLDVCKLRQALSLSASNLCVFWSLPSTNDYCLSANSPEDLEFCLAEFQSAGRGRRNARWQSGFATSILLSRRVAVRDYIDYSAYGPLLSLFLVEGLRSRWPDLPIQLKWPNDILLANKKWMGILMETQQCQHHRILVIGMGCNVMPNRVVDNSVGIVEFVPTLCRTDLTILLMRILRESWFVFVNNSRPNWTQAYDSHHVLHGQTVVYRDGEAEKKGLVLGVDFSGRLRLQNQRGLVQISSAVSQVRLVNL